MDESGLFGPTVIVNVIYMNSRYVDHLCSQRYPSARVTAATVAGFYFYATYYTGTNHTEPGSMADFRHFLEVAYTDYALIIICMRREEAWPVTYDLYDAFVDEDCKEYFESQGLSAGRIFPYISSRLSPNAALVCVDRPLHAVERLVAVH